MILSIRQRGVTTCRSAGANITLLPWFRKCQMTLSFKSISKIPSDFKDNTMTVTTWRSAGANITLLPWCRMVAFPAARFSCARAQSHPCTLFLFLQHTCFRFSFLFTEIVNRLLAWLCLLLTTPVLVVFHTALVWKARVHSSLSPRVFKASHQTKKELNKAQKFRSIRKGCNVAHWMCTCEVLCSTGRPNTRPPRWYYQLPIKLVALRRKALSLDL